MTHFFKCSLCKCWKWMVSLFGSFGRLPSLIHTVWKKNLNEKWGLMTNWNKADVLKLRVLMNKTNTPPTKLNCQRVTTKALGCCHHVDLKCPNKKSKTSCYIYIYIIYITNNSMSFRFFHECRGISSVCVWLDAKKGQRSLTVFLCYYPRTAVSAAQVLYSATFVRASKSWCFAHQARRFKSKAMSNIRNKAATKASDAKEGTSWSPYITKWSKT